ncbi:carboxylesterase family protein [Virgibacillus salexigens]|uniref:carboxylesterase family protein n=1 Tax=Virgibacillus salexigens TaxID=61016 RepID=UPI001F2E167B
MKQSQGSFEDKLSKVQEFGKGYLMQSPQSGNYGFAPPAPLNHWEGELDATEYGPSPQNPEVAASIGATGASMSENCLNLNVWAPTKDAAKLPVMVWIHGGAFRAGAGNSPLYNGATLSAQGNVVVVTINYRLGPLGFLYLAGLDERFTGNIGLLDQIAALKWVKENSITERAGCRNS